MRQVRCDACRAVVHDGKRYVVSGSIIGGWAAVPVSVAHPLGLAKAIYACPECKAAPPTTDELKWHVHVASVRQRIRDRLAREKA